MQPTAERRLGAHASPPFPIGTKTVEYVRLYEYVPLGPLQADGAVAWQHAHVNLPGPNPARTPLSPPPSPPCLFQAWDLYYHVFKRINKQLHSLTTLELQYVSPALVRAQVGRAGVGRPAAVRGRGGGGPAV